MRRVVWVLKIVLLVSVLTIFSLMTISRIRIWNNEISFWSYVVSRNPQDFSALSSLGRVYLQKNNCPIAMSYFEKALKLPAREPEEFSFIFNNMATCYTQSGEDDQAEIHYKKSIEILPRANNYHNLGNFYYLRGERKPAQRDRDYQLALTCFQESYYRDPYNARIVFGLAVQYERMRNKEEAKKFFQEAIDLDPQSQWANWARASLARLER